MNAASTALAWLEELAGRRRGALVLLVVALGVYALEAVAWPLIAGRDLDDYLRYYIQLTDSDTLLPAAMLFRTPVTPIVAGLSLDVWGGRLAEPALAVLYAGSILAWSAAARAFGRRAALVAAICLLLYPGYGAMFHELASEPVFAASFAGFALLVTRVAVRPSPRRFALVGLGVAFLALVRPGNQVLVVFCLFPLLLPGSWRRRLVSVAAVLVAAVVPLGLYAVYNGLRYGDYTVARGGESAVPFYRAYVVDRIISPDNGPASRKLVAAIERDLLTRQPYTGYGITLERLLSSGSARIYEDLVVLSDRDFGWDSSYGTLSAAGREAVLEHPGTYASGVARTVWSELRQPYYRVVVAHPNAAGPGTEAGETVVVHGRRLPRPSQGEPIPPGQSFWISRPDGSIREVWTSPTRHVFTFAKPGERRRFEAIQAELDRLYSNLPSRRGNATAALWLNRLSRWYPRPYMWLAAGVLGLVVRRPRRWQALAGLTLAALIVPVFTALGLPTDLHYLLPVAPAYVFFAACAWLGARSRPELE